jgi:Right handed beta helix region
MDSWFRPSRRQGDRSIRRIHARRRPLIETLEGRQLLSVFQVTSLSDSGTGTLRQAILSSNATSGTTTNSITFDLAKSGTQTISLSSALPKITHSVDIDGTTEPGYVSTPLVIINGTKATKANESSIGLEVQANGSTFKGLVIDAFNGGGVVLDGASGDSGDSIADDYIGVPESGISAPDDGGFAVQLTDGAHNNSVTQDVVSNNDDGAAVHLNHSSYGNLIAGNKIGTDPTGTKSLPNGGSGVIIDLGSYNNTVGGTTAGAANVISGNKYDGVHIEGPSTYGNLVEGNFIGTDVTGTKSLSNGDSGVEIDDSNSNTIGGTAAGAMNVLSANTLSGVTIDNSSAYNLVEGNRIGTDVSGTKRLGNAQQGVEIETTSIDNTIGGTASGAGNLVSANGADGIYVYGDGVTGNLLEGNKIGTDVTGSLSLSNGYWGVGLQEAGKNSVGGPAAGAGNLISGNAEGGVAILGVDSVGDVVQGNFIGTNLAGTKALGNAYSGVYVGDWGVSGDAASGAVIGGSAAGDGNVISGNGNWGIWISDAGAKDNLVQGNKIGTDVTGTLAMGNDYDGVEVATGASYNTIGGSTAGALNVISGNLGDGVDVLDGSNDNLVEGNYVGTDVTGEHVIANSLIGVMLDSSSHNTVGGTVAGARNVISGNDELGVKLTDETATSGGMTDNLVEGNYVGTDALGTKALANQEDGLLIDYGSEGNTVGGTVAGARNVISGNVGSGVELSTGNAGLPVSSNLVEGNYLGTTAGGNVALHNGRDGVEIIGSSHNTIGGTAAGAGNVIAGNAEDGVYITNSVLSNGTTYTSSDNVVQGNLIGWTGMGNTGSGVHLDDSSAGNTIGGTTAAAGNTIEGNGSNGVYLNSVGLGNAVGYDTIESNGGDGVFLYDTSLATTVTYCTIELNAGYGILMEHSYTLVTSTDTVIKNVKGQIVTE